MNVTRQDGDIGVDQLHDFEHERRLDVMLITIRNLWLETSQSQRVDPFRADPMMLVTTPDILVTTIRAAVVVSKEAKNPKHLAFVKQLASNHGESTRRSIRMQFLDSK